MRSISSERGAGCALRAAVALTLAAAACGGSGSGPPLEAEACDPAAAAPCATSGEIGVAGSRRRYLVVSPGGDPSAPRALVFVFHGANGSGWQIREAMGRPLEAAAAGAAVFVYPDGLDGGWADPSGRDVALFDALLASFSSRLPLDPARVFATGFSYGADMSATLACARAGAVRAVAALSGGRRVDRGCVPGPVAAWVANGTRDQVIPVDEGQALAERLRTRAGCAPTGHPVDPGPCLAYDACGAHPVVFCAFDGGHEVQPWQPAAIWAFFGGLTPP